MSVLLMGDSMAQGLSWYMPNAEAHYQIGWTTPRILPLALSWIRNSPAQVVVVALGTNDITAGVSPAQTASAASQIAAAASGRVLLWAGAPSNYNANGQVSIGAIQSAVGGSYFDSRSLGLQLNSTGHPDTQGFKMWADVLIARLNGMNVGVSSNSLDIPQGGGESFLGESGSLPQILFFGALAFVVLGFLED
jgi:hypothetical protein